MGVRHAPDFRNWLGVIAFSNMPFLHRTWIIAEIILARKVEVVWGSEEFFGV